MRQPVFRKTVRGRAISETYTLPAPVGGWNARDSAANMSELDAVLMENWFPETNDIRVRKGFTDHVTGVGAQVESLMPYNNPDGTTSLFAAASTSIYDVTPAGAVGAAVVTGQTNARWQHVNFTNSTGTSYLCNFNGADPPQYWDGTSWITITGASTPAITGITTSTIVHAAVHKRRMWLVVNDSLTAYYLPVDAVGGAVGPVPLGGIANLGGFIQAIGTWTLDAGEGADDYWVAFTSEGQVVVYRGTDPTSSSTWKLHGVWNIGNPIGRRCMMKYQGDILLLTNNGVIPLSKMIVSSQTDPNIAITNKIEKAMTDAANDYKTNFGWQTIYFPQADMILLNVPVREGVFQEQYAMNTITGNWGRFKGVEANCWAISDEKLYFGSDGEVVEFWGSLNDNGSDISAEAKQAENYFGARGRLKYFKSSRPVILSDGNPSVGIDINPDYTDNPIETVLAFLPQSFAIWDAGVWDSELWGAGLRLYNEWSTNSSIGTSGGFRLKTVSNGIEVRLQSSDHVFEYGGIIA